MGTSGQLLRWDGSAWTRVYARVPQTINAASGRPVTIAASTGKVYREMHGGFVDMQATTVLNLYSVTLSGAFTWVGGDASTIVAFDGTSWTSRSQGSSSYRTMWRGVSNKIWVAGTFGAALRRENNAWTTIDTTFGTATVFGLYGFAANDVWAVGSGGRIRHYDGATFSEPTINNGTTEQLNAVWGSSASDVWAVGNKGNTMHWTGSAWDFVNANVSEDLDAVAGRSASETFAFGQKGRVLQWDGNAWIPRDGGTTEDLRGAWGDSQSVLAVGGSGRVIERYGP